MDLGVRDERARLPDDRLFNQLTAEIVRPAVLAMALLYLFTALASRWLGRPPEYADEHRTLHWIACSILLACWCVQMRRGVSERSAHPWLLFVVALVSLVNARELVTIDDPSHGFYLTLTAVAAGYGFLSTRWFAAALALLSFAWLTPILAYSPLPLGWRQWTVRFGTGLIVSVAVFVTRRRSVMSQAALRRRAEERERAASVALAEVTTANEKRHTMQRAMQAAQRRESLGLMAGGIAHDFNNLLTVIGGNLEVVTDELERTSPLQESLADATAATEHATRLTRQMLAYAGRAEPKVASIDLGRRIRDIVRMLDSSLPAGVRIHERGGEQGPVVQADGAQLDQVLINLVQNAVDACRDGGGTISVEWGVETLDEEALTSMRFGESCPAGDYAYFDVKDDGQGMEQAVQEHIFEPFFTTKAGGSGLGLAAVEGIAERHDAALVVSSARGKGTCVRFLLPQTGGLALEPARSPRAVSGGPGAVLLVDDELGVRRVARRFLEHAGLSVLEASSGRDALGLARSAPTLRVALLDLTMPDQNGYDVAEVLRAEFPSLPIVIMSGFDRDEVVAGRPTSTDYVFLAKPFSRAELAAALREATSSFERFSPRPERGDAAEHRGRGLEQPEF